MESAVDDLSDRRHWELIVAGCKVANDLKQLDEEPRGPKRPTESIRADRARLQIQWRMILRELEKFRGEE
jgi:hypothetical protein